MIGTNFMEEIDCGNFFDHMDDLLDFPNDDVLDNVGGSVVGCGGEFPSLWPDIDSSGSELPGTARNSASDLSAELSVPYEDIIQLEWLSSFVDDSTSGGGLMLKKSHPSATKDSSQSQSFQTSSPVSVLESSSSSYNGIMIPITHEKRARSKRPRPPCFTPRVGIQLTSPTSSVTETPSDFDTSVAESRPLKKLVGPIIIRSEEQQQKKKKKIKILPPSCSSGLAIHNQSSPNANPDQPLRKCQHCEVTKTPQWRAGPMGPKTLCNACGVRYKSGRLFPEYRPAASPTFVPSLHSNSHKKVVEMRTKSTGDKPVIAAAGGLASTATAASSCQPDLVSRS